MGPLSTQDALYLCMNFESQNVLYLGTERASYNGLGTWPNKKPNKTKVIFLKLYFQIKIQTTPLRFLRWNLQNKINLNIFGWFLVENLLNIELFSFWSCKNCSNVIKKYLVSYFLHGPTAHGLLVWSVWLVKRGC